MTKKYSIAIIGGTGKFGTFWKNYFNNHGHEVIICGRKTNIKPVEAIKIADIIIVSVSIRNTKSLLKNLIPYIPENKLLIDFTGIKSEATKEMKKYKKGEVVGTHPMFGPNVPNVKNQNIAYDPISPGEKWKYLYNLWKKDGANLIEMTSKRHDELIGIIQPTTHFINFIFGFILKEKGVHPEELVAISTPISRIQTYIFSRFLWQQANLYADMQICNDVYKKEILTLLKEKTDMLSEIINKNDFEGFEKEFEELKKFVGNDFLEKALKESSKVDEKLKK